MMDSKSDDGMDDKNLEGEVSQGGEGGTKRRRRGDAGERNYTCGCGKSYLSYPALYTHIKTKHDGVTPAGTSQPQTNGKSGRGRPKKEESAVKVKEEEKGEHFDNQEAQQANDTVINYLRSLGERIRYENQEGENAVVSDTIDSFDLVERFPRYLIPPHDYDVVFEELENIYRTKNIGGEDLDKDTGLKKTNMNKIFAVFIYIIGRRLTEQFYKEFVFFLMMYRRALNDDGWVIKAEVTQIPLSATEKRVEYCAINNGEYAPDICNDFITERWNEYLSEYDLPGFKVLGSDTEGTKNAVFLTQHFCNWLKGQRYSNSVLMINDDNDL